MHLLALIALSMDSPVHDLTFSIFAPLCSGSCYCSFDDSLFKACILSGDVREDGFISYSSRRLD